MTKRGLLATGLIMPPDFDSVAFDNIHRHLCRYKSKFSNNSWEQYGGAWNAVAYRYYTCAEHDAEFTTLIKSLGVTPSLKDRYLQERELFGFFVTGLSTIESLCYGLFAIASNINAKEFAFKNVSDYRRVNPENTCKSFKNAFPNDAISRTLNMLIASQQFKDWKEIRNVLAHRTAPGRIVDLTTNTPTQPAYWKIGIALDDTTTSTRRFWLSNSINAVLGETDSFTMKYFV